MSYVENVIEDNKRKYGAVYAAPVGKGLEVYFRPLTVGEYEVIELLPQVELEDAAVEAAVFWPENFDPNEFPPGHISALANEVLEVSSFFSIEDAQQTLAEARADSNTITNVMKAAILAVRSILDYSLAELNDMTFRQLSEKAMLAEQIIRIQKTIHDPTVEFEIAFAALSQEEQEEIPAAAHGNGALANDPTAAKLYNALHGGQ